MQVRSFAALLIVAALLAPAVAAARVVRLTCHDGIAPPLPRCVAGCSRPVRCDADEQCDGVCTFAIRVCGEVACSDHLVGVPVGQRQKITLSTSLGAPPTTFVLRCRAHPPTIPCPVPSTSTTTVTTTSSTTLPGGMCQTDPDCDDGNPCTHDACVNGTCVHECLCVGPAGEVTCCPGPGPCSVPTTTTTTIPTGCDLDPALSVCGGSCPPGLACLFDPGIEGVPPGCACLPIDMGCTAKGSPCNGLCPSPALRCLPPPPGSEIAVACLCRLVEPCQQDTDCIRLGDPCARCVDGICQSNPLCL